MIQSMKRRRSGTRFYSDADEEDLTEIQIRKWHPCVLGEPRVKEEPKVKRERH